jgi:aminopeptidase N
MKWFLGSLLLVWLHSVNAAAPPHLDLEVTLDPQTRAFHAKAELRTAAGVPQLVLDPLFKLSRVALDGVDMPDARSTESRARQAPREPATPQRFSLEYSGTLPALPESDPRKPGVQAGLFASPEGSYLSPGAGWYPDPGVPFTYTLRLSLPAGQKGLAPGRQKRASETGSRYIADYEFSHPAEGVWIMAGPYQVAQQSFALEGGSTMTVRTWFHPELAGLAAGYLQDSGRYLQRYSRLIGNYPFGDFSVVSSPLPHGLGIPSLTYLGRDVLRLPFIRATSLGHEVLHNWWGNGVYPEWSSGNWSEGLTTFMADYAFREEQSEEAAREMRLGWLRDLAAVSAPDETALADFKSRQHGISSVVGYAKSAMLFLMLRDEIGSAAFNDGLRQFWQRHQFKAASWKDLEATFSRTAGRDLTVFFAQWVRRPSSTQLLLAPRRDADPPGSFRLIQQGRVFDLLVPLRLRLTSGANRDLSVRMRERETVVDLAATPAGPDATQVELDPELRLWRRLDPKTVPPIFREVFVAPRAQLFLASKAPAWRVPATALAARLLDAQPSELGEADLLTAPQVPVLVIGDAASIRPLLPILGMGSLPEILLAANPADPADRRPLKGTARAWAARAPNGKTFAFVLADSPEQVGLLQRSMPHYGRQSWLVFQEGRVSEQGAWPVAAQRLSLNAKAVDRSR